MNMEMLLNRSSDKPQASFLSTLSMAIGCALLLLWLAYPPSIQPVSNLVWRFTPDFSVVNRVALGHVLSLAWMATLIHVGLRLTGATAYFRPGPVSHALVALAVLLPVILGVLYYVQDPETAVKLLFYTRDSIVSLSAVPAGIAVLLAVLGYRYEVKISRRLGADL
jgi:hypothetical protein